MEILIIQKEAFEEMAAKFSRFAERVDALLAKQGGKSLYKESDIERMLAANYREAFRRVGT